MSADETKQTPLVDRNPFVAEVGVESLELLADAVRSLNHRVKISIGPDKLVCKGADMANTIAVRLERPVEASHQETIAVESEDLAEAIDGVLWGDDHVAVEIVSGDDGKELQIYDSADEERFWYNAVEVIDDSCSVKIDSLADHEFDAVAETEAWQLAGTIRTVSDPADIAVRVTARDGGLSLEGDEIHYIDDSRDREWKYPDHCRADVELSAGVSSVRVPLMDSLAWNAAEMIPLEGTVTVNMDENYPVVLESSEGVTVAIAPRKPDSEVDSE